MKEKGFNIPTEWMNMSKVFSAMGDEHRQRILLMFEKGERLTAGEIASGIELSQSTVSHHLKILKEANILFHEKKQKEVWFWINKDLLKFTFENCLNYVQDEV